MCISIVVNCIMCICAGLRKKVAELVKNIPYKSIFVFIGDYCGGCMRGTYKAYSTSNACPLNEIYDLVGDID